MFGAICQKKLLARGCISTYGKINTMQAVGRFHQRIVYGSGFGSVLVSHLKSIVYHFTKIVAAKVFVANINAAAKLRKINIDPPWVLGFGVEKSGILHHFGIHRNFETVRKARLIENLILMLWQRDIKIASLLWNKGAVAGKKDDR